jgi:hypothetical protein
VSKIFFSAGEEGFGGADHAGKQQEAIPPARIGKISAGIFAKKAFLGIYS